MCIRDRDKVEEKEDQVEQINVALDISTNYKFSLLECLQKSGSISLVKSGEILGIVNSLVNETIEAAKVKVQGSSIDEALLHLNSFKNPFSKYSASQYQLEKSLRDSSLYLDCTEIWLGSHFKFDKRLGRSLEKKDFCYHFKLKDSIKNIIQKYSTVINTVQVDPNSSDFVNFKSGSYYKSFEGNPLCLQIYFDEIE